MSSRYKVLCIDDDVTIHALLKARLEKSGQFQVSGVIDPLKGIDRAANEDFDVILLDWIMSNLTGLEALDRIRGDSQSMWTPVFMLTAKTKMPYVERALAAGATGYLSKPIDVVAIEQRLMSHFEANESHKKNPPAVTNLLKGCLQSIVG